MTARNARSKGPATDTPLPRKPTSSQREIAALRKELAEIKERGDFAAWLLAELLYGLRLSAVQQLLATPQGQSLMAKQVMEGKVPAFS